MRWVVAAAAIALAPRVAFASHCGGGGHGGGGHGGGGHGGGGHGHSCHETNPVVGYMTCSHFGAWSSGTRHPLAIEVGVATHRFLSSPIDEMGSVTHVGQAYAFRVISASSDLATTAVAPFVRVTRGVAGPLYIGSEGEVGGIARGPTGLPAPVVMLLGAPADAGDRRSLTCSVCDGAASLREKVLGTRGLRTR